MATTHHLIFVDQLNHENDQLLTPISSRTLCTFFSMVSMPIHFRTKFGTMGISQGMRSNHTTGPWKSSNSVVIILLKAWTSGESTSKR